jgi:murein DD-endopeptidase MepM/ murein hydrolase activator NlpD
MALVSLAVMLSACARDTPPPAGTQARSDRYLVPDTREVRGVVPENATLAGLLHSHLAAEPAESALRVITASFDARKLRAHQPFQLTKTLTGMLRAFRYEIDNDRYLHVEPASPLEPAVLRSEVIEYKRTIAQTAVVGRIDADTPSLFQSMERAGETIDLSMEMAAIFAGEIDFNTELQPGDQYRLAFEKITRENGTVSYGTIQAAEFSNDGRVFKAIRFVLPDGKAGYYDENGRSLKRFFLKSPLKFEPRITSRFSYSRLHPVLNIRRAHLGVDYAAPIGAPVVAVSNGVVLQAGLAGGAGRLVTVRHASGYETMYMHLSSIAVRAGQHVSQGEVLGRVGSSGLSTGPHLDYRIRKNGAYVNPLTEHRRMPPGEPIPPALLAAFTGERDKALALLPPATGAPARPGAQPITAAPVPSPAATPHH